MSHQTKNLKKPMKIKAKTRAEIMRRRQTKLNNIGFYYVAVVYARRGLLPHFYLRRWLLNKDIFVFKRPSAHHIFSLHLLLYYSLHSCLVWSCCSMMLSDYYDSRALMIRTHSLFLNLIKIFYIYFYFLVVKDFLEHSFGVPKPKGM